MHFCRPTFEHCMKFAFDRRGSRVIRGWIFHRREIVVYVLLSAGHLSPVAFLFTGSLNIYEIFTVIESDPQPGKRQTVTECAKAHACLRLPTRKSRARCWSTPSNEKGIANLTDFRPHFLSPWSCSRFILLVPRKFSATNHRFDWSR